MGVRALQRSWEGIVWSRHGFGIISFFIRPEICNAPDQRKRRSRISAGLRSFADGFFMCRE
jgi:hypothetical protein